MRNALRQVLTRPRSRVLMLDEFSSPTGAPDTRYWTETDTENKISLSGGNLVFAAPGVPGTDIAVLTSVPSFRRIAGLTLLQHFNGTSAGMTIMELGWYNATPALTAERVVTLFPRGSGVLYINVGGGGTTPFAISESTDYWFLFVLKTAGHLVYVSDDQGVTWKILWESSTGTTTPLYVGYENTSRAFTSASCKVYYGGVKSPLLSAMPAAPTLTLGAEEATGTLTVGLWYSITATQADYFYTGSAIGDTFKAAAATALDANNKVKNIPFSTTGSLTYIGDAGRHNGIYDASPTVSAVTQVGVVSHANSATAPTYCLHAYYNRLTGKACLDKVVNGVLTELIATTAAYSAAAQCRVVSVDTKHGLYYNGVIVSTIQTLDVSANYGTHVHGFSTLATDTIGASAMNGGIP